MSKTVVAAIGSTSLGGLTAASVGGVYALGAFRTPPVGIDLPKSKDDLKNWNGGECNYFKDGVPVLNATDKEDRTLDSNSQTLSFFEQGSEGKDQEPFKSCLLMNWNKSQYKDKKWEGTLSFLWSVAKGNRGLMVFVLAEAKDAKLYLSGSAYVLENKYQNFIIGNEWTVRASDEIKRSEMKKEEIDKSFPKFFTNHSQLYSGSSFITSADYDNIRGPVNDDLEGVGANDAENSSFKGRWEFTPLLDKRENQEIQVWSPNLVHWCPLLYNVDIVNVHALTVFLVGRWDVKESFHHPASASKPS